MSHLNRIESLLADQPSKPPIHKWHPQLSGDIDIVIRRDGSWVHEGQRIERQALVRLFATILRREDDGEYYLVTPVEKWRLEVEDLPLQMVDMEVEGEGEHQHIAFKTNTGEWVRLGPDHPLTVDTDPDSGEPQPSVRLDNGLEGRVARTVFYRLVEHAQQEGDELAVYSDGERYSLGRTDESDV